MKKLTAQNFKKFISIAKDKGVKDALKKAFFTLSGYEQFPVICNDEQISGRKLDLVANLELVRAMSLVEECRGVIILGSRCMGWFDQFKQRHHHIADYLIANGFLVICAMNPLHTKDLTDTMRMAGSSLFLVNFEERWIREAVINFIATEISKPKFFHLVGTDPGTTEDDVENLMELDFHIFYDYCDALSPEIFQGELAVQLKRHKKLLSSEEVLAVATADKLYEEVLQERNTNVILSPNGVTLEDWVLPSNFEVPLEIRTIASLGKPIIGFYGSFAPWINYEYLLKLAERRPQYEIVLIGYDYEDGKGEFAKSGIKKFSNVHVINSQPYENLKFFSYFFDVGLVPFKDNELSDTVNPVKMFEYFAQGIPTVTSGLIEAKKYAVNLCAENAEDFLEKVDKAVFLKKDPAFREQLREEASRNTWDVRGSQVLNGLLSLVNLRKRQEKLLTIVVPLYNMAELLPRCLESLLNLPKKYLDLLEVIVINDGSKDTSLQVVRFYERNYPAIIKIINKENGGHGSCINVGIHHSTAKYVKLLDSDDWLDTVELIKHLNYLQKSKSDLIVTDYTRVFNNGKLEVISYGDRLLPKEYSFSTFVETILKDNGFLSYAHMHSITYKTSAIKNNWKSITEKSFYVDQEYITLPLINIHNISYQRINLYRYWIGRKDQSISPAVITLKAPQCLKVLEKILEFRNNQLNNKDLNDYLTNILYHQAYFYLSYCNKKEEEIIPLIKRLNLKDETLTNTLKSILNVGLAKKAVNN